jgi:glycine dehydrogenase subunit 1
MLEATGAESVGELFASIPAGLRLRAKLDLPDGLSERDVIAELSALAARNQLPASFQGAGAYRHFVPAAVGQILSRSEFATAYTPYQPEVSQGTLQATFEFQTYVAILLGLDVANASVYDGASALAEAVLMALRVHPKRDVVLLSSGLHPEYRAVVRTYLRGYGRGRLEEIPLGADGRTDLDALEQKLDESVAAIAVGYPSFYGVIDDLRSAAALAHRRGALAISATTEALALGLLAPPGACGADIAVAEGQSLGLAQSYGGPGVGLFATRQDYLRQMPGRLVGQTVDDSGRRGYVLTLSTREQHIRREKATSNICTNQGLAALAVTVFLGLAGRRGLRALAAQNVRIAHEVAARLRDENGTSPVFSAPFFNEFTIDEPRRARWHEEALAAGVVPGVRLQKVAPGDAAARGRLLVTVTEMNTPEQIDALVAVLGDRQRAHASA